VFSTRSYVVRFLVLLTVYVVLVVLFLHVLLFPEGACYDSYSKPEYRLRHLHFDSSSINSIK
jgi:hypothetical protein